MESYPAGFSNQNHDFKELTDSQIQMILEYIIWELHGRK